ncbi:hypothetical protein NM688_g1427 [Phlebia brevispora]|uniref:Uncharacterized protein n=1 Tax=Phlebia brevispora TaxID=194682 RepID=A0ACC1TBQ2_9APHY|nr:hypothetical protein NM688_g1427 [Phlebia brevispora]
MKKSSTISRDCSCIDAGSKGLKFIVVFLLRPPYTSRTCLASVFTRYTRDTQPTRDKKMMSFEEFREALVAGTAYLISNLSNADDDIPLARLVRRSICPTSGVGQTSRWLVAHCWLRDSLAAPSRDCQLPEIQIQSDGTDGIPVATICTQSIAAKLLFRYTTSTVATMISAYDILVVGAASEYLTVSALTWTLWDSILTSVHEVHFVRKLRRGDYSGLPFLINRYSTLGGLSFLIWSQSHLSAGTSVDIRLVRRRCTRYFVVTIVCVVVSLAAQNVSTAFHMYTLWERRKGTLTTLAVALVLTYSMLVVFTVVTLREQYGHAFTLINKSLCALTQKNLLSVGIWASVLAFDLFMLAMFVLNAFDQPYRRSSEVFKRLRTSGILMYTMLAAVRVINIIVTVSLPPYYVFTVPVTQWAINSIAMSRLLIQIEGAKASESRNQRVSYEMVYM